MNIKFVVFGDCALTGLINPLVPQYNFQSRSWRWNTYFYTYIRDTCNRYGEINSRDNIAKFTSKKLKEIIIKQLKHFSFHPSKIDLLGSNKTTWFSNRERSSVRSILQRLWNGTPFLDAIFLVWLGYLTQWVCDEWLGVLSKWGGKGN